MAFDWQKLQRDEDRRNGRAILPMGIASIAAGSVGTLIVLLTPLDNWIAGVAPILLGVWWLVLGLRSRKQKPNSEVPTESHSSP